MAFNSIDLVFLAVIGLLGLRGLWRGIIREVAMIGGVCGGLVLARLFYRDLAPYIAPHLAPHVKSEWAAGAAAFAGIFAAVYAAGIAASIMLRRFINRAGAGGLERAAGLLFGAFEGTVLIGVFLLVMRGLAGPDGGDFLKDSLTAPAILKLMDFLSGLLRSPLGTA